jgi:hypothetical protein
MGQLFSSVDPGSLEASKASNEALRVEAKPALPLRVLAFYYAFAPGQIPQREALGD